MTKSPVWQSRVFWTSIAGIIGTCLVWWSGGITAPEALAAIWAAAQTVWLRQTVATRLDRVHDAICEGPAECMREN